jgi:hypothetical protein
MLSVNHQLEQLSRPSTSSLHSQWLGRVWERGDGGRGDEASSRRKMRGEEGCHGSREALTIVHLI